MKYCNVSTSYRGTRVYVRSAMGMPGSETALEELMCRVLGELLQAGAVAKLADDLYWGGNTPAELLDNWTKLLLALHKNNPHLSASKTMSTQNPRRSCVRLGHKVHSQQTHIVYPCYPHVTLQRR